MRWPGRIVRPFASGPRPSSGPSTSRPSRCAGRRAPGSGATRPGTSSPRKWQGPDMADRKIYFATDIHGSEVCLRKFLNAGKFYGCDTLIMGGDITGKMIVPIVDRGQGVFTATLYGRNLQVTGDGLAKLRKTIADAGYYAYETTPEEMERFRADPDAVTELFGKLRHETLGRWLGLTEERMAGSGSKCICG